MESLCFDPDGDKCTQVEKPVPQTLTVPMAEETGFYSRAVNGVEVAEQMTVPPLLFRRQPGTSARNTTFSWNSASSAPGPLSLAPSSHAGSGLPPSGTTRGASGASQSTPGCLWGWGWGRKDTVC